MGLSKKMRFEVFKRDAFKCQYCGGTPPAVILEIDHVDPKSGGFVNLSTLTPKQRLLELCRAYYGLNKC